MATIIKRFWPKVNRGAADECWNWKGARLGPAHRNHRYGIVRWRGKWARTHRVAWELVNGPIPDGAHICHSCGNPICCNPAHLYAGTPKENMADRDAHGRTWHPLGEANPRCRLRPVDVLTIRERLTAGETQYAIASEYGVHRSTVKDIWQRRSWRHI